MVKLIKIFVITTLIIGVILIFPKKSTNNAIEKADFGVFYSYRNAEYWGLDRNESFNRLLADFDFKWITLPFFWNEMVEDNLKLKLETLTGQIEEAKRHDKQVIITIGIKAPGYPEFYYPAKFNGTIEKGQIISITDPVSNEFLQILPNVVGQLSKHDNIKAWQIENEPLWTSINGLKIDYDLVAKEIEIVKSSDYARRPVLVNHPATPPWNKDYRKVISLLDIGDYLGINVHTKTRPPVLVYFKVFGKLISIPWPSIINIPVYDLGSLSPNLSKIKKEADKNGIKTIITELQAEPYFSDNQKEQGQSLFKFTQQDIFKNAEIAKKSGIDQITFWGSNYWYAQSQKGDNSWLNAVKKTL